MFKDAVKAKRIEAVLAACPNPEWRVIVALGGYGGLRCPSETLTLKWADTLGHLVGESARIPCAERPHACSARIRSGDNSPYQPS